MEENDDAKDSFLIDDDSRFNVPTVSHAFDYPRGINESRIDCGINHHPIAVLPFTDNIL
jgi:hypothetical protein